VPDEVWEKLRVVLAERANDLTEEQLRLVVNTLLFRHRTGLNWENLPADRPDSPQTRAFLARWDADGSWNLILRKMTPHWKGSLVRRALRRAKWLARLAVRAVWWPVRATLKGLGLGQPIRKALRWGPIKRLASGVSFLLGNPTALLAMRAEAAANQKEYREAIELYSQVVTRNPRHAGAYFRRAMLHLQTGKVQEALRDCHQSLALVGPSAGPLQGLHHLLARCLLGLGASEQALSHMFQHLWLSRCGSVHPDVLSGQLPPRDALGLQVWIEAHDTLAEDAINLYTDFTTALSLYRRKPALQEQFRQRYPVCPAKTLYLPDDWVRNIGHMALIDFWAKMKMLGWRDFEEMVLLAPSGGTANAAYLEHYRQHFQVVTDPEQCRTLHPLAQTFGPRVACLLELPGGAEAYFVEGMGLIQEEWERQGRGPLLRLTEEERERGWATLQALGVPRGNWFVSLHVRTAGFHKEGQITHQAHRNADIRSYFPAMRAITERGGWVIRLGDPSMPPLPKMPGVIDYAHHPIKSASMDVFLCGAARFFIGVASGMAHLPLTFGVPSVFTNWLSNTLPVYSGRDLFLPKLRWSLREQRLLTFAEWLPPAVRKLTFSGEMMEEAGLGSVDNTAEELREVVEEMLQRLEGVARYTPEDERRWQALRAQALASGLVGFARIGRDFLRRHANLLPTTPELRQAG
jgi:putative glycosyltransferase (TIGR04372 family)